MADDGLASGYTMLSTLRLVQTRLRLGGFAEANDSLYKPSTTRRVDRGEKKKRTSKDYRGCSYGLTKNS